MICSISTLCTRETSLKQRQRQYFSVVFIRTMMIIDWSGQCNYRNTVCHITAPLLIFYYMQDQRPEDCGNVGILQCGEFYNVFSGHFGISAPISLLWKFSVVVTYLMVIHLIFTFLYLSVVRFTCLSLFWHGMFFTLLGRCWTLFCLMFLVYMLCGSCERDVALFLCCYQICGKMDNGLF